MFSLRSKTPLTPHQTAHTKMLRRNTLPLTGASDEPAQWLSNPELLLLGLALLVLLFLLW